MQIMQALLHIPTVFERSGDSSHEDLMVAQAICHNVKATYVLPMGTLEWAGMSLRTCGLKLGQAGVNRQAILACMVRLITTYDSSVEVDAYDMQPTAKIPRRGRKQRLHHWLRPLRCRRSIKQLRLRSPMRIP